jgi:hypothetical protein
MLINRLSRKPTGDEIMQYVDDMIKAERQRRLFDGVEINCKLALLMDHFDLEFLYESAKTVVKRKKCDKA